MIFQGFVTNGQVPTTLDSPTAFFRGVGMKDGSFCIVADTGQSRVYINGIAVEASSGKIICGGTFSHFGPGAMPLTATDGLVINAVDAATVFVAGVPFVGSAVKVSTGLATPFLVEGVDFDGTNDYMTRGAGLTGAADNKKGTYSVWFRLDGGNASNLRLLRNSTGVGTDVQRLSTQRSAADVLQFFASSPAAAVVVNVSSAATFTSGAAWHHWIVSYDLSNPSLRHQYIDGVSDASWATYTDSDIDYTVADWAVGATPAGTVKFNGCMAEVFFHNAYIDLSVAANLQKFRSALGKPVDLGVDGSTPLGVQPLMYQSVRDGGVATGFATNRGSGGNFTITGSLDIASTSPSD